MSFIPVLEIIDIFLSPTKNVFISKKSLYVCSDVIFDGDAMFDVFKHFKLMLAMISSFMKHLRKDRRIITMRSCNLCTCGP